MGPDPVPNSWSSSLLVPQPFLNTGLGWAKLLQLPPGSYAPSCLLSYLEHHQPPQHGHHSLAGNLLCTMSLTSLLRATGWHPTDGEHGSHTLHCCSQLTSGPRGLVTVFQSSILGCLHYPWMLFCSWVCSGALENRTEGLWCRHHLPSTGPGW